MSLTLPDPVFEIRHAMVCRVRPLPMMLVDGVLLLFKVAVYAEEEDQEWQRVRVGPVDGIFECVVTGSPLLTPVSSRE